MFFFNESPGSTCYCATFQRKKFSAEKPSFDFVTLTLNSTAALYTNSSIVNNSGEMDFITNITTCNLLPSIIETSTGTFRIHEFLPLAENSTSIRVLQDRWDGELWILDPQTYDVGSQRFEDLMTLLFKLALRKPDRRALITTFMRFLTSPALPAGPPGDQTGQNIFSLTGKVGRALTEVNHVEELAHRRHFAMPPAFPIAKASLGVGDLEPAGIPNRKVFCDMPKLKSMTNEQFKSPEWVNEIQLSGTFRLGGKGFASLITPRGNFWVEEGKSSSGYKLIELDTSQSQPSALIQKGDQQAWVGLRSGIVPRTRVVGSDELEKRLDASGTTHIMYVVGESEPFTGMGVWYNKDGSKNRESVYENGKLHGTEIRYTKDGRRLEIPYVDGKKHGMQTWYYETGNKKEETPYVEGKRHGTEVEYRWGYKWRETPYVDGKIHGMRIRYRGDGSKEKVTPYENGYRHGMEIWYFKDGSSFKETPFVDGHPHGMVIQYHENGSKRMESQYVDGKRIGMEIMYYEDGSKFSETPYVDGNANGTVIKYRRNGSKEMETVYVKHSKQSEVWYREDGSKWKEMPYKGHVLHGTAVSYHKDGSTRDGSPWVQGKVNGRKLGLRQHGSKAMETLYENGKEISRKEF